MTEIRPNIAKWSPVSTHAISVFQNAVLAMHTEGGDQIFWAQQAQEAFRRLPDTLGYDVTPKVPA